MVLVNICGFMICKSIFFFNLINLEYKLCTYARVSTLKALCQLNTEPMRKVKTTIFKCNKIKYKLHFLINLTSSKRLNSIFRVIDHYWNWRYFISTAFRFRFKLGLYLALLILLLQKALFLKSTSCHLSTKPTNGKKLKTGIYGD